MHLLGKCILFLISLLYLNHDFHASITKIEYSEKNQSLQCIMNVFVDDLELALSNFHHREIKYAEYKTDIDIIPYLKTIFILQNKKNKILPIQYIGSERKPNTVRIYFEIPCPKNDLKYLSITHTLLFNEFNDQVNTVNLYALGEKKSIVCTKSEPNKIIRFE